MSKDDSSRGFLSKVVKFMRHPTTSWSDLDTRTADSESELSKAALKEMIERKRRNDFVRRREFEQLRRIRSREASGGEDEQGVRPSFFQSSLPSKPDDRAMTLKKIDEIEAQMSMQWWKTKGADSLTTGSSLGSGAHSAGGSPLPKKSEAEAPRPQDEEQERPRPRQYKDVEVAGLLGDTEPMARTSTRPPAGAAPVRQSGIPSHARTPVAPVSVSGTGSPARTGLMAPTAPSDMSGGNSVFSPSRFFALDVQEVAQNPEVEEAAIRFANGDDRGAEQGLLDAVGVNGGRIDEQEDWLALFDLYRATGQLAPFESRAVDFINRFARSAPQWFDMPQAVAGLSGKTFPPVFGSTRAVWVCAPGIGASAVETLQSVLLRANQPWVLDWSAVVSIDVKAARDLLGVFKRWGDQDVSLAFVGAEKLRELLKSLTPSGRRDVEPLWWELRMAALRVMNRPDEFELTALDFCVTYEVSPASWERPRCQFQALASESAPGAGQSVLGESVMEQVPSGYAADSVMDSMASGFNQLGLVELSGEIRGDPQDTLNALEHRLMGADVLIISCRNLIRVDFSAAGTLLNWVSGHHAEGRLVQFVDTHRLVAAFFDVIGITEYAKVVLRND